MDIEELYDYMSELLEQAIEMTGDESISSPYDAIDALTDLMEENFIRNVYQKNYNTIIGDLIDEISYTMEDIDSMESQDYFENEDDIYESRKSNKKVIKLTEKDLTRIVKRIVRESRL